MENLYVYVEEKKLYVGLNNGENYARLYWLGGIDSCLYKTEKVKVIAITDTKTLDYKDYIILEDNTLLKLEEEENVYNYYMNNNK